MDASSEQHDEDNPQLIHGGTAHFPYKTLQRHLIDYLKGWGALLTVWVGLFGIVVTFMEASMEFGGGDPRSLVSYTRLLLGTLFGALVWQGYQYFRQVPEGMEGCSARDCRIGHLQRTKWQFTLARSLLAQRLGPLDRQLRDLEQGKVFINSFRPDSFKAYSRWIDTRFPNLDRMLETSRLVLADFVGSLYFSTVTPKDVVQSVDRLARFYRETVAYEEDCRSVQPIPELATLHTHTYGWSDPIRGAVEELFAFIKQVEELPYDERELTYSFTYDAPAQAVAFSEEIRNFHGRPDILEGW